MQSTPEIIRDTHGVRKKGRKTKENRKLANRIKKNRREFPHEK